MVTETQATFDPVDTRVSFPTLETEVLAFWREHDTFRESVRRRQGGPHFSFYEGPPTANGHPGTHHILARVFKDFFPRYKTMRGYEVPRIAGWDCHGLPVEVEVEKRIGSRGKQDIEAFGVERFIDLCRESVREYVAEFDALTERIGYWCDLEHPYWTMDSTYIESEWNLLRRFWDGGLLTQGYKVVPYCPRCATPLSTHEVAQGYKEVDDLSVYVKLRLDDTARFGGPTDLLVWTTTPWTLPGNVAVAINPTLAYVLVRQGEAQYVLAEALLGHALEGDYEVVRAVAADELLGQTYRPLFTFMPPDKPAYRVVRGDYVTAEDGTGLVHIAPAFGEDDLEVGRANDLPVLQTVDTSGRFLPTIGPFAGMRVKPKDGTPDPAADPVIVAHLRETGDLYRVQKYRHQYPHCWRCDTPLLYYALSTWFLGMASLRDRLLATNDQINWVPEHYKEGRFGTWLANANDWALSRNRYWGTPLPVWVSETTGAMHCVGSLEELRRLALDPVPDDLHRPYIDRVRITSPEDGSVMRRVPEVIDTWFDSGAMPFAQFHYPFENVERDATGLPGGLHLRGGRPDARLVLLAPCHRHRTRRLARVQKRHLPRPHPRCGRTKDEQVTRQRRGPVGIDGRPRRGRDALVLLHRHRARQPAPLLDGHRARGGVEVLAHALELVRLFRQLRAARWLAALAARPAGGRPPRTRPLGTLRTARADRDRHGVARCVRRDHWGPCHRSVRG